MGPIVAIIGRPNVGKSTLLNALARKNVAVVHDRPGVTRDRNYRDIRWDDRTYTFVDTGGVEMSASEDLTQRVREQARAAVEESDLVLFLLDGREGLMPDDTDIARMLQKSGKPVLYVVNKVEGRAVEDAIVEFYNLGVDDIISISAEHRMGLNDLLMRVAELLPEECSHEPQGDHTVVSIIGRPNVGKSSIINRLLGQERLLVSDRAGTTRDSVDSRLRYEGKTIRIIDTAGIRRKSRISYSLEKFCVMQALKSIYRSTVCVLVLDATQEVTAQDAKLASEIHASGRACVILLNKWDLIAKDTGTHESIVRRIRRELSFIDFAPVLTVSALTGQRVRKLLETVTAIGDAFGRRVSTSVVNREMQSIYERHPPPRGRGKATKIYYAAQIDVQPPQFKLYTNNPSAFPQHYLRFLERALRERLGFDSVPVCIEIQKR